ncbi:Hypothetical predicted protein [Olea europaea subsp. europaea]|uniref:Uncharacterized protein n=1 Tax=Olea europaea subsp. europaea TaxID=158383 RepID=A0A8S0TLT9_OLEEU|nr:Hypothetical predicted protein [Olea europaea subsp. europaea]
MSGQSKKRTERVQDYTLNLVAHSLPNVFQMNRVEELIVKKLLKLVCKFLIFLRGEPGIGETQLRIQLATNVQIPADYGGLERKAVYIGNSIESSNHQAFKVHFS